MSKKLVLIITGLLFFTAMILSGVYWFVIRDNSSNSGSSSAEPGKVPFTQLPNGDAQTADKAEETIRIVAVGDNIPHETVDVRAQNGADYDFSQFYDEVDDLFKKSDIRFCNQESPSAGEAFGISGYPTFNAPMQFSRDLKQFGCNVVNLANNHVADKGEPGIQATRETWEALGEVVYSGANTSQEQQYTLSTFDVKGVAFAFVAFTDLSNNTSIPSYSINMFSEGLVDTMLGQASQQADYVIVSAHWGTEDSQDVNESQRRWAQYMTDKGADLIIGTGPHVLQTAETLKAPDNSETIVFYSIGNFLSSQLLKEELLGGMLVVDLKVSGDTISTEQIGFLPTYMHYDWTAAEEASGNLLARTNLKIYPLDIAGDALARTRFNTTTEAETARISSLLNSSMTVTMLTSTTY